MSLEPLLAADCVSFLVGMLGFIGFVVWVITQIVKAVPKAPQGAPPPERRAQAGGLQKEIDIFLRQVSPKSQGQAPQAPARRPVEAESRARQASQGNRRDESASRRGESKPLKARQQRPGDEIASRRGPGRGDLGAEVREHVSKHLDSRTITDRVQEDLGNRVQQSVAAHLGESSGKLTGTATPAGQPGPGAATDLQETSITAREFRRMLNQPAQIRQAILLNEILSRPLALRNSGAR